MGDLDMLKKHKNELIGLVGATVGIVLLLLVLVWIFEYFEIHVPGTREMWIGLIGAVTGGAFTLFGVLITIFKQEDSNNEQKRLENMPILGFEICEGNNGADWILTYTKDGLITSGFPDYEKMDIMNIAVKTVNNLPVFDFTIEGCAINGKEILLTSAFNPSKIRIVSGEFTTVIFNYAENLDTNIFCIIRFSYKDIFGNKYYQDLPFTYYEYELETNLNIRRQGLEIRDIKQPILINQNTGSLEESAKAYVDYEAFCN